MPSLDGLRALSIAVVFFAHSQLAVGIAFPGGFGVTVFFFLSGFLITTLLRREYETNGSISFGKFYLRRVLRILPPFYLVLGGALIATRLLHLGTIDVAGVRAQALHYTNYWIVTHGFDGLPGGTGVFWSLAVEEHFYLLFPLVFVGLMRSGARPERQALVLLGTCAALLAWRVVLCSRLDMLDPLSQQRLEIASDTRFDSILFGCILALYGNPALDPSRFGERAVEIRIFSAQRVRTAIQFLVQGRIFSGYISLHATGHLPFFHIRVRGSLSELGAHPTAQLSTHRISWGALLLAVPRPSGSACVHRPRTRRLRRYYANASCAGGQSCHCVDSVYCR